MAVTAPDVMRCSRCKTDAPLNDFHKSSAHKFGRHPWCRSCRRASWDARYAANGDAIREDSRWRQMTHRYGLSRAQYDSMLEAQGGVCAICKGAETDATRFRFSVDHDRKCCPTDRTCGKCVRGLLCNTCNRLLGMAADDPQRLRNAAIYLEG
jgi:hypothetical protein